MYLSTQIMTPCHSHNEMSLTSVTGNGNGNRETVAGTGPQWHDDWFGVVAQEAGYKMANSLYLCPTS